MKRNGVEMGNNANRMNILLIMADQFRADCTGYLSGSRTVTPNIDRIAQGIEFTNCQTVNPICSPARAALITGKYTHQIGMLSMSGDLSLQHPTFMRALQNKGYHTCGIGKLHLMQTWNWDTKRGEGLDLTGLKEKIKGYGFDYLWETAGKQLALKNYCDYCRYLDEKGLLELFRDHVEGSGENSVYADHMDERVIPWPFEDEDHVDLLTTKKILQAIENRPKDKPFYIFGSYCSPHKPFDPPQKYLEMVEYEEKDDFIDPRGELTDEHKKKLFQDRYAYRGSVKLIDDQIGLIIDMLSQRDLLDNTLIIFTSDHGEMLGDHFRIQKSIYWRNSVTVPLAIRHPKYLYNIINSSQVENIDIAATILDVAGIDHRKALSKKWPSFNDAVPCKSLLKIITGEKDKIRDFSFSECEGKWQMIQTDKWKYVRHLNYSGPGRFKEELYDLECDFNETLNLIDNDEYFKYVEMCRLMREFVLDNTMPAQLTWTDTVDR